MDTSPEFPIFHLSFHALRPRSGSVLELKKHPKPHFANYWLLFYHYVHDVKYNLSFLQCHVSLLFGLAPQIGFVRNMLYGVFTCIDIDYYWVSQFLDIYKHGCNYFVTCYANQSSISMRLLPWPRCSKIRDNQNPILLWTNGLLRHAHSLLVVHLLNWNRTWIELLQ